MQTTKKQRLVAVATTRYHEIKGYHDWTCGHSAVVRVFYKGSRTPSEEWGDIVEPIGASTPEEIKKIIEEMVERVKEEVRQSESNHKNEVERYKGYTIYYDSAGDRYVSIYVRVVDPNGKNVTTEIFPEYRVYEDGDIEITQYEEGNDYDATLDWAEEIIEEYINQKTKGE